MTNRVLHNVLSTSEITDILNNSVVIQNKEKLMTYNKKIKKHRFSLKYNM